MTAKEKKLASLMLELASEKFSNHGCNDVDFEAWTGWSIEERRRFVKEYREWNGDPEEYSPDFLELGDDAIMSFLAYKLTK
jgi:hypothetical protein